MKKMRKLVALLLVLALAVCMLAACSSSSDDSSATSESSSEASESGSEASESASDESSSGAVDRNLTVGTTKSHLYTFTAGEVESDQFCRRLVYDQIFYIDDVTGEFTSDILTDWGWEDDVTLRLVLRDDVYFSDGTQMTGEDILATCEQYVKSASSEMEWFDMIDYDASYVADDGLTTYLIYKEVYAPAVNTLIVPVLSKDFMETHPDGDDAWWYAPVGSGPYAVGDVVMGTSVEYVLRDDYWNADANYEAETITVKFYSETTSEYADFKAGTLDMVVDLTNTQVQEYRELDNANVVIESADDVCLLAFNESTVPEAVRKAIAYGVDWDNVAMLTYGDMYTTPTSHFATTLSCYSDHSADAYTYDVEYAKQILADAGISEGEYNFTFPCFAGSTDAVTGEAIQMYLSELGIGLTINEMEISSLLPALMGGDGDLSLQNLANTGNPSKEPNQVVSPFASDGFKIMAISDSELNDLLVGGLSTVNTDERNEYYHQVDQWLYDNYQAIPIAERAFAFCYNSDKLSSASYASMRGSLAIVSFN